MFGKKKTVHWVNKFNLEQAGKKYQLKEKNVSSAGGRKGLDLLFPTVSDSRTKKPCKSSVTDSTGTTGSKKKEAMVTCRLDGKASSSEKVRALLERRKGNGKELSPRLGRFK